MKGCNERNNMNYEFRSTTSVVVARLEKVRLEDRKTNVEVGAIISQARDEETKAEREEGAYIQMLIKWNRQNVVPVWMWGREVRSQGWLSAFCQGYLHSKKHHHHPRNFRGPVYLLASETAYVGKGWCFPLLCCWNCILGVMGDTWVLEDQNRVTLALKPQKVYQEMYSPASEYFPSAASLMNTSELVAARSHSGLLLCFSQQHFFFFFTAALWWRKNKILVGWEIAVFGLAF